MFYVILGNVWGWWEERSQLSGVPFYRKNMGIRLRQTRAQISVDYL